MGQRAGGRNGRSKKRPHHVRATLLHATYMFDGDGRVMGIVKFPQRASREPTREGGRPLTLYTRDVLVNNMARGKVIHGERCEYLWRAKIVWLIEPVGAEIRAVAGFDPTGVRVGAVATAPFPRGDHGGASGWICRAHLKRGWKKQHPVALDKRTGRVMRKSVMLRSLGALTALTETCKRRDRRIRPRETHPVKNRETDYLLRNERVINIRIGEGSGLSSDTLIHTDRLRFRTSRIYDQPLYRRNGSDPVAWVKNYRVKVTASLHGGRNIRGWAARKLLKPT